MIVSLILGFIAFLCVYGVSMTNGLAADFAMTAALFSGGGAAVFTFSVGRALRRDEQIAADATHWSQPADPNDIMGGQANCAYPICTPARGHSLTGWVPDQPQRATHYPSTGVSEIEWTRPNVQPEREPIPLEEWAERNKNW
jgi:hypothetical protein